MFKKLTVVVNRAWQRSNGYYAIRRHGGTIMHGRGTGSEFTTKLLGMEIEPEKELVMILMPNDLIDKVVNDLFQELQLNNPGNGILFVEPVLDVRGLFGSHRKNNDS